MKELSILIGGKAGDGVKLGANIIARLFNRLGYNIFIYEDYPSLIRGGHNFAIIRASEKAIAANHKKFDVLIALNQETIDKHSSNLNEDGLIIFDSDSVKAEGVGISLSKIARDNDLPLIVRNIISFGTFAKIIGVDFKIVEECIKATVNKKVEENIKVAKEGFDFKTDKKINVPVLKNQAKPLITGNDAIAVASVKAGLKAFIAYPMTPASSILHTLAKYQDQFKISVVHPENEIAVALMAEGLAYAGVRSMVATSGGGFALMTEALSFAGQAEFPFMVVLSQRPGPATGVPTYSAQADLFFALSAGHGEFPRIVLAPCDVDQAFYLSADALNLAWKFQTPVILLVDKHLSESTYSANFKEEDIEVEVPKLWKNEKNKENIYKRYSFTEDGISPLAFPGDKAVVKATSYEHDESGITIEDSESIIKMISKRALKNDSMIKYFEDKETIKIYGNKDSDVVLFAWGSTVSVVKEVAEELNVKVVQPLFLEPFPVKKIKEQIKDVKKIVCVELNVTGQLATLLQNNGIVVDNKILKFDSRPFFVDELKTKINELIK